MRRLVFFLLAGCMAITLIACEAPSVGYNEGYMPKQPIPYDHSLHAGTYKIPCLYCHVNVDKGSKASIPSLNVCMNCHNGIATDKPYIKQLTEAYNNNEPIKWEKVHLLPDFVHFKHSPHIMKLSKKEKDAASGHDVLSTNPEAKQQACYVCHGRIDQMKEVYQVEDLSMGWCLECHRKPESNAPVNCSTCHY